MVIVEGDDVDEFATLIANRRRKFRVPFHSLVWGIARRRYEKQGVILQCDRL
jgi:hypothetical protein